MIYYDNLIYNIIYICIYTISNIFVYIYILDQHFSFNDFLLNNFFMLNPDLLYHILVRDRKILNNTQENLWQQMSWPVQTKFMYADRADPRYDMNTI